MEWNWVVIWGIACSAVLKIIPMILTGRWKEGNPHELTVTRIDESKNTRNATVVVIATRIASRIPVYRPDPPQQPCSRILSHRTSVEPPHFRFSSPSETYLISLLS